MSEHPQAAILRAIADDKDAEERLHVDRMGWIKCTVTFMLANPQFDYRIAPKPNADGWIPWHGGENPVPGKRVKYRLLCEYMSERDSKDLRWDHCNSSSGIIAYRVVEPKLEKVYYLWARLYPNGMLCYHGFAEEGKKPFISSLDNDCELIRLDWSRTVIQEGK